MLRRPVRSLGIMWGDEKVSSGSGEKDLDSVGVSKLE